MVDPNFFPSTPIRSPEDIDDTPLRYHLSFDLDGCKHLVFFGDIKTVEIVWRAVASEGATNINCLGENQYAASFCEVKVGRHDQS